MSGCAHIAAVPINGAYGYQVSLMADSHTIWVEQILWCPDCGALRNQRPDGEWRQPTGVVSSGDLEIKLVAADARGNGLAKANEKLHHDLEQLRVQLAGCGVAAKGGIAPRADEAKPGDFGWSASYGDVLETRYAYEALLKAIDVVRPALKWIKTHAEAPEVHNIVGHADVALDAIRKARLTYEASEKRRAEPPFQGQKLPSATPLDTAEMRDLGRVGRLPLEARVNLLCDEIDRLVAEVRTFRSQLETLTPSPEETTPEGWCPVCHAPTTWTAGQCRNEGCPRFGLRWDASAPRCPCCDEPRQAGRCEGMWCATYGESFVEVEAFVEGPGHCSRKDCPRCDAVRRRAELGNEDAHWAVAIAQTREDALERLL